MTRITNADQVLLLLRAQLQRSEKQRRKETSRTNAGRSERGRPLERLKGLIDEGRTPHAELARAMIAAVLADDLGEDVVNEPRFQAMVEQVWTTIERDPASSALLRDCVASLR
ncbi:MAG: hypothetical protein H7124_05580 [Phycisphaerales bacterium]|nr:hypothetical protein [Hyphomonadaceae bacterium]